MVTCTTSSDTYIHRKRRRSTTSTSTSTTWNDHSMPTMNHHQPQQQQQQRCETQQQPSSTRRNFRRSTMISLLSFIVFLLLVSSPPYSVSSFLLHRQHHSSHHSPTISSTIDTPTTASSSSSSPYSYRRRAPRPSSTLVTTKQQTASLHAPPSQSLLPVLSTLLPRPPKSLVHDDEFIIDEDDYDKHIQLYKSRDAVTAHIPIRSNIYGPVPSTSKSTYQKQQKQQQSPLVEDSVAEYQRRRDEWAQRYTTLPGLRAAFGSNKNKLWGDLDARSTRRLYKTLLPNALCELIMDLDLAYITPEDLAPLAYKARKAAKLYARERCHLPSRIMAQLFDGFRALRTYGKFQPSGLTYKQIWDKYQRLILEDVDDSITEEEIVARTCLKIMERSCKTNESIDKLFLKGSEDKHYRYGGLHSYRSSNNNKRNRDLQKISQTLESDVRKLLDPFSGGQSCRARGGNASSSSFTSTTTATSSSTATSCHRPHMTQQQYHALKHFALARRRQQLEAAAATATAEAEKLRQPNRRHS